MSEQEGKVAQKSILLWRLEFLSSNLLPEDEIITDKQPILHIFFYPLLFKYLIVFTADVWERVKQEFRNEGNLKLFFPICDISDLVAKIIKGITSWVAHLYR